MGCKGAKKKLLAKPGMLACGALLDQAIFAGSGNIIKNEVLFRTKIHPRRLIGTIPAKQLQLLIKEVHKYGFDILKWKKKFELKKHLLSHTKKTCPHCSIPLIKEHLGKTHRSTFYCNNCQILYE